MTVRRKPCTNNVIDVTLESAFYSQNWPVHRGWSHFSLKYQVRPILESYRVQHVRNRLRKREYCSVYIRLSFRFSTVRFSCNESTANNVRIYILVWNSQAFAVEIDKFLLFPQRLHRTYVLHAFRCYLQLHIVSRYIIKPNNIFTYINISGQSGGWYNSPSIFFVFICFY